MTELVETVSARDDHDTDDVTNEYGTGAGVESNKIHPDLATDLGTASNGNKTWKFTLKSGVKWQDGSAVT